MTKKGLSLEQKREKILQIFLESDDVYQLKEIEKEGPKRGVTAQSIKEVVQSLVDDNLVHQEKIGSGNFLWAFAAEATTKVQNEEVALTRIHDEAVKQREKLKAEIEVERSKQEDPAEHAAASDRLEQLRTQKEELQKELDELQTVDPERFKEMKAAAIICRDSANRWLDNVYSLQKWCKKKFSGRDDDIDKFFLENGLTSKVDYID
eukprot:jgi/Ulvmu1/211/UM001_0215.1